MRYVLFIDPLPEKQLRAVRQLAEGLGLGVRHVTGELQPGDIADVDYIVLMRKPVTATELAWAERLRLIVRLGSDRGGLPLDAARDLSIPVITLPNLGSTTVAEHTMLCLLALSRRLVVADRAVRSYRPSPGESRPTSEWEFRVNWPELSGITYVWQKALGLVGFGEIGREVALRARAFGMRVYYHQRRRLSVDEEQSLGVEYRSLPDLLKESDFVSLHLPLTAETRGMIGKRELDLMKPSAFLINTSRGGVVVEQELYEALRDVRIAGAALDVFADEPPAPDNPLLGLDNVVLTPHIAACGSERERFVPAFEVIERVERGEEIIRRC